MVSNWKTQKGDEWSFENKNFKARADRLPYLNECKDSAIIINSLESKKEKVSNRSFLKFLQETSEYFVGCGIIFRFQEGSVRVIPHEQTLNTLTEKSYIKYQVNTVAESSFECVKNWVHHSNTVIEITVLNKAPGLIFL